MNGVCVLRDNFANNHSNLITPMKLKRETKQNQQKLTIHELARSRLHAQKVATLLQIEE